MAKYLDETGVQTLWNKCKSTFGTVKTVNGSSPDANGNINVSGGVTEHIHNIIMSHTTQHAVVSFQLKTNDASAYTTASQVVTALFNKGYIEGTKSLHASGKVYVSSSNNGYVIGVYVTASGLGYVWTPIGTNQTITTSSVYVTSGWTLVQDQVD